MAGSDFSSALDRFTSASARLNAESDSVNAIILDVEQRLVAANPGAECWLDSALTASDHERSARGETTWTVHLLGFSKVDGEWCIAVKPRTYVTGFFEGDTACPYRDEFVAGDTVPLLNASRDLRIAALSLLPELIESLAEIVEHYNRTISETKGRLVRA